MTNVCPCEGCNHFSGNNTKSMATPPRKYIETINIMQVNLILWGDDICLYH